MNLRTGTVISVILNRLQQVRRKSSEKTSKRILALLKENPRLSAKKLSELLGISSRAVEKQIASLEDKGRLKREGSPKAGHWKLL